MLFLAFGISNDILKQVKQTSIFTDKKTEAWNCTQGGLIALIPAALHF